MMSPDSSKSTAGSQTLERALRLLTLLRESPEGLTVAEIATRLGTHRAGVYRLVRPLQQAELVERRDDGAFVLGVGLITLAAHVRTRLQEVAATELQHLARELRATSALTVRSGNEALVVLVQEPLDSKAHIAYRPGLRHPLTQAASGLAILSGDAPNPDDRPEVAAARETGYAITQGELFPGATGIGAPIYNSAGASIAALSVVWLGGRLNGTDEARAVNLLCRSAKVVSAALAQEPSSPAALAITSASR